MMYRSSFRALVPVCLLLSILYGLFSGCQQEEPMIPIVDPVPTGDLSVVIMPDTVAVPPDTVVVPPVGLLVDSMIGTFYGTCYHYRRDLVMNELVHTYDTTYNTPYNVSRIDSSRISATGCGATDLFYGYYLPVNSRVDTIVSSSYFIGPYYYSMDVDFRIRTVTAFYSQNPLGGAYLESWKGVWHF